MRKLVKILLSLLLVAPATSLALGVGDVQLHSGLNQRLDAEIKLLSVDAAEADSIEVSLASYEDFAKVGLERPASLMFMRFGVEQAPNGEYYIKLSSREAIRDPFLDFLVEVKWRSGRVLREYTLLLDPPVSHQEAAPAITAPVTTPSAVSAPTAAVSAPTAAVSAPTAVSAPKVQAVPSVDQDEFVPPPSSIPVAPGYEAQAVAAKPAPTPAPAVAASNSIVYGPVKANETLWSIARKLRPNNDITDQQMMMALLIANPYAFIDNNINRLKKGYVLRIDDLSVLTAMSKAEAAREVSRQTRVWQDYRSAIAAKTARREPTSTSSEAPIASVGTAKKVEPKLELVTPGGKAEQPGKATEGADGVQQELMLALESSAAQAKENEELQKRVEGLEERLQDMQRLLTLKDADLAALQSQLSEQAKSLAQPSTQSGQSSETASAKSEALTDPVKSPAKETEAAEKTDNSDAQSAVTSAPVQPEKAPAEASTVKPSAATSAEKPTPANKPPVKKPPVVVPPEEPGLIDSILGFTLSLDTLRLDDPVVMAAGGGAALLILLLLMVMIRRRRSGGGFQESILTGGTSSMMGSQDDDGNSETSFLSDLAISGMGKSTIHTDEGEVDPLTEADVFMAYGRHQQAEEVLSKALEKHPERHDLSAKLLDVYYNLQDADKFVALSEKSAEGLKAKPGEWERIAKMGNELSPGNALFAVAAGAAASAVHAGSAAEEGFDGGVLDIGLDLDELTSDTGSGGSGDDLGFDLGLDFDDLNDDESPQVTIDEGLETAEPAGSDFEFDMDLGGETVEESTPVEPAGLDFELGDTAEMEAPATDSDNEFELDLGSEDFGSEAGEGGLDFGDVSLTDESELQITEEDSGLDLGEMDDLDFGDFELGDSTPSAESSAEETFDLDMSGLESAGEELGSLDDLDSIGDLNSTGDLDSMMGDLDSLGELDDEGIFGDGDGDDISTKLDLAQAYIEMGDSDGARSMLEEVAEGGNAEQKQQAQALLARI